MPGHGRRQQDVSARSGALLCGLLSGSAGSRPARARASARSSTTTRLPVVSVSDAAAGPTATFTVSLERRRAGATWRSTFATADRRRGRRQDYTAQRRRSPSRPAPPARSTSRRRHGDGSSAQIGPPPAAPGRDDRRDDDEPHFRSSAAPAATLRRQRPVRSARAASPAGPAGSQPAARGARVVLVTACADVAQARRRLAAPPSDQALRVALLAAQLARCRASDATTRSAHRPRPAQACPAGCSCAPTPSPPTGAGAAACGAARARSSPARPTRSRPRADARPINRARRNASTRSEARAGPAWRADQACRPRAPSRSSGRASARPTASRSPARADEPPRQPDADAGPVHPGAVLVHVSRGGNHDHAAAVRSARAAIVPCPPWQTTELAGRHRRASEDTQSARRAFGGTPQAQTGDLPVGGYPAPARGDRRARPGGRAQERMTRVL